MDVTMDTEKVLTQLGDWSQWKLGVYFLVIGVTRIIACWQMFAIVFVGLKPPYHCKLPHGHSVNESVPRVYRGGQERLDQCRVWYNYSASTNLSTPCPQGWDYTGSLRSSIVQEWDLVCERSFLIFMSQSILGVGVACGAFTLSIVSDKVGRKTVIILSGLCISVVGFLTAFSVNVYMFLTLRFFTGFFQQGAVLGGTVYVTELFSKQNRATMSRLIGVFWSGSMILLALVAWAVTNWRHLLLVTAAPGLLVIPLIWLIPESVLWLMAKGRYDEVRACVATAARVNGKQVANAGCTELVQQEGSRARIETYRLVEGRTHEERQMDRQGEKVMDEMVVGEMDIMLKGKMETGMDILVDGQRQDRKGEEQEREEASNYSVLDILKSRHLVIITLINCYIWWVSGLVYYGISLNSGALYGNPYVNFMLMGLIGILDDLAAVYLLNRMGRRWTLFVFNILAGVTQTIIVFIPAYTGGASLGPLITTLVMVAKFCIGGAFGTMFVYTPELYPTTLRNVGLGLGSVGCRIGNVIAPFTPLMAEYVEWLPSVVFGCMALVAGGLVLVLPETTGRPLPTTLEDLHTWTSPLRKSCDSRRGEGGEDLI